MLCQMRAQSQSQPSQAAESSPIVPSSRHVQQPSERTKAVSILPLEIGTSDLMVSMAILHRD